MLRLSLFAAFLLLMSGGCSKKTAEKPAEKSKSDEGGVPTAAPAKQAPSKEAPTEKLLDNRSKNQPADRKLGEKEESDEKGGRKDTEPGTFDTTVTPPASMTASPKTGVAETKMKSGEAKRGEKIDRLIKKQPPMKPLGLKRPGTSNASMGAPLLLPDKLKSKGTTHKHDTDSTEDL